MEWKDVHTDTIEITAANGQKVIYKKVRNAYFSCVFEFLHKKSLILHCSQRKEFTSVSDQIVVCTVPSSYVFGAILD